MRLVEKCKNRRWNSLTRHQVPEVLVTYSVHFKTVTQTWTFLRVLSGCASQSQRVIWLQSADWTSKSPAWLPLTTNKQKLRAKDGWIGREERSLKDSLVHQKRTDRDVERKITPVSSNYNCTAAAAGERFGRQGWDYNEIDILISKKR